MGGIEWIPRRVRRRWATQPRFEDLGRERLDEAKAKDALYPSRQKRFLVGLTGLTGDWRRSDER